MNKLFYLLAAATLITACNSGNNGYTITGTVEGGADGDSVFLLKPQGRSTVNVDSTVIKNGQFTFTGIQDTTAYRYISYKGQNNDRKAIDLFLENGDIKVQIEAKNNSAIGTANNDIYQKIRVEDEAIKNQLRSIFASLSDTTMTEAQRETASKEIEQLEEKNMQLFKTSIAQNITNPVGIYLLKQFFYYMSVDELNPLMPQIPACFDNDKGVQRIKEQVAKMNATAVGQKFTDFTMNTPEGKEVKLSDFVGKGKVVLVDFWASWCGPCRREMPNLVEAYKKYKNKNFEIVGVSLDRDAENWKKAIKQLNITWPQMSDLKFWNCEGAQIYAVSSIPHVVLIDGEGTIIARGLHGEELLNKLAEVLK